MTKPKSKMSLAEQIAALNDPAPSYDPEDASDTETRAKVAEFEEDFHDDVAEVLPSKLRRRVAGLLADDKRYAGQTTSRKNLNSWSVDADNQFDVIGSSDDVIASSDDVIGSSDVISSGDDQRDSHSDDATSNDEDESGIVHQKHETKNIEDAFKRIQDELDEESSVDDDFEEEGEDDDEYDSDEDEYDRDEDEDHHSNVEAEDRMAAFSEVSIAEELAKGKATKTQLTLWDAFMENRIKIQKALAIANQLPSFDKQTAFVQEGGQVVQEMLHSSSLQLKTLLKKLNHLQEALLLGNQATRHIIEGQDAADEDSDEEITSSDEDKDSHASHAHQRGVASKRHKRKADSDLGEVLSKRYKDFEHFQYDTIQKWHDRTKLVAGKQSTKSFSSFEKSAVSQIHQVLQDKTRLIKRTQLRRTVYRRLGDAEERDDATQSKEDTQDATSAGNAHLKDFDEETFDDDDFYHQLLRELIDKRTSSTSDPVQLTRQWLEVQKLRRKIKKKVDTRASKGRKIRYDVHPKLVSFMAGRDSGTMMDSAKNELFSSLFGRRKTNEDIH